ncbi:MAG: sulfurtransferase, partial [Pseudomonadota bacterium]
MPAPNEITVPQLGRLIGTPECPAIIDICIDADFEADPFLIPGSRRHPHTDIPGLFDKRSRNGCRAVCQSG